MKPENAKELLLARQAALLQISKRGADARKPVALDQQSVGRLSRMDAMQQQAMAIANEQNRVAELQRISAALRRIESEEFGICLKCGEEIASKRLEVDPSVAFCIECASLR